MIEKRKMCSFRLPKEAIDYLKDTSSSSSTSMSQILTEALDIHSFFTYLHHSKAPDDILIISFGGCYYRISKESVK